MLKLTKNFIIYSIVMFTMSGCFSPETLVSLKHKILGTESDDPAPPTSGFSLILSTAMNGFCLTDTNSKDFCWGINDANNVIVPYAKEYTDYLTAESVLNGKTIKKFTTNDDSICAIASDDKLYCWGSNTGNATTVNSSIPVAVDTSGVLNGKIMIDVAVIGQNSCAIDSAFQAYCWGINDSGQLGNGTVVDSLVPVAVSQGALTFKKIVLGSFKHACAIAGDDTVYCWGSNLYDQLGNGTAVDSSIPVQVDFSAFAPGLTAVSIHTTAIETCILASDAKIYCWGFSRALPARIDGGALSGVTLKSFFMGFGTHCAIDISDQAYCWGDNTNGQLGNGTNTVTPAPVAVTAVGDLSAGFKNIVVGDGAVVCAIAISGKIYCWGNGEVGIGNGAAPVAGVYADVLSPTPVESSGVLNGKILDNLIINASVACATDTAGAAYCWGNYGLPGDGISNGSNVPLAVSMTGTLAGKSFKEIQVSSFGVCGLASDDQLYCWGAARDMMGSGGIFDQPAPRPVYYQSLSNTNITNIVFKFRSPTGELCVQRSNGDVYCKDFYLNRFLFNFSMGSVIFEKMFYSDFGSYCALATNQKVYCWGTSYQIFLNIPGDSLALPLALDETGVLSGKTIKDIVVGFDYGCVLASDDKVYCWGGNSTGQLGNGSIIDSQVPVALDVAGALGVQTVKKIYNSGSTSKVTCVIASDDLPYCWGEGSRGLLGNGSISDTSSPVAVTLPVGVKAKEISMTDKNVCVITLTDKLYCWGLGNVGVLGNGGSVTSSLPIEVVLPGALSIKKLSLSNTFACAIASDDNAYCWGDGSVGEMGDAQFTAVSVPVAVSKLPGVLAGKTITSLSTTSHTACVVASDEKTYCWGAGVNGQLANNISADSNVPVEVLFTP